MKYLELLSYADQKLFIIAEAGVNHNGSLETALRLVDAAIECGCDAIKFQTWITERVYSQGLSVKPKYQILTTDPSESEFETIKKLELTLSDFECIKDYCQKSGIVFFSTPDEIESANFLIELGMPFIKTASQDVTNTPFLRRLSGMNLPIIFSTGACTMAELAEGVEAISSCSQEVVILHCVSSYPAPFDQMNLAVIPRMAKAFGFPVGLSDHTEGSAVACAAVALGARIFEKHLTLDRNMQGPDHQASLTPDEMRAYCQTLRNVYSAIGNGIKRVMPCELDARSAFRRFIVIAQDLKAGTRLSDDDLVYKKIVSGISPKYLDMVIGKKLNQDVTADTTLEWHMLVSN